MKYIMFGYNMSEFDKYNKMGIYDTIEECTIREDLGYQFYVIYKDEGLDKAGWDHLWHNPKVVVNQRWFNPQFSGFHVPVPLSRCVSNNLKDFYFY